MWSIVQFKKKKKGGVEVSINHLNRDLKLIYREFLKGWCREGKQGKAHISHLHLCAQQSASAWCNQESAGLCPPLLCCSGKRAQQHPVPTGCSSPLSWPHPLPIPVPARACWAPQHRGVSNASGIGAPYTPGLKSITLFGAWNLAAGSW